MVAASAWGTATRVPAAVSIAICQNRRLKLVAPAIPELKNRCPLTRLILKSGYSNLRFRYLFVVAEAKSVHQRRPSNCSAFRPNRSKKASHSVKKRHVFGAPAGPGRGLPVRLAGPYIGGEPFSGDINDIQGHREV